MVIVIGLASIPSWLQSKGCMILPIGDITHYLEASLGTNIHSSKIQEFFFTMYVKGSLLGVENLSLFLARSFSSTKYCLQSAHILSCTCTSLKLHPQKCSIYAKIYCGGLHRKVPGRLLQSLGIEQLNLKKKVPLASSKSSSRAQLSWQDGALNSSQIPSPNGPEFYGKSKRVGVDTSMFSHKILLHFAGKILVLPA